MPNSKGVETVLAWVRARRVRPDPEPGVVERTAVDTPWWPDHVGIDSQGLPITREDIEEDARPYITPPGPIQRVAGVDAAPLRAVVLPDRGDDYDHLATDAGVPPDPIWVRAQYPVRLVYLDRETAIRAATEFGGAAVFVPPAYVDLPPEFADMIAPGRAMAAPIRTELRWHADEYLEALSTAAAAADYPPPSYG